MSPYMRDLMERLSVAFAEGFLSGLVITSVTDTSMWLAALTGGTSSVVSVLKSLSAKRVGNPTSASLNKNV